jgi:hypothetical protein
MGPVVWVASVGGSHQDHGPGAKFPPKPAHGPVWGRFPTTHPSQRLSAARTEGSRFNRWTQTIVPLKWKESLGPTISSCGVSGEWNERLGPTISSCGVSGEWKESLGPTISSCGVSGEWKESLGPTISNCGVSGEWKESLGPTVSSYGVSARRRRREYIQQESR